MSDVDPTIERFLQGEKAKDPALLPDLPVPEFILIGGTEPGSLPLCLPRTLSLEQWLKKYPGPTEIVDDPAPPAQEPPPPPPADQVSYRTELRLQADGSFRVCDVRPGQTRSSSLYARPVKPGFGPPPSRRDLDR